MSEIKVTRFNEEELYHHGVKGMKWGVRRRIDAASAYGNSRKQSSDRNKEIIKNRLSGKNDTRKIQNGLSRRADAMKAYKSSMKKSSDDNKQLINESKKQDEVKPNKTGLTDKQKTALKVGAAAAGTALAAYGAYKLSKVAKNKAYEKNLKRGLDAATKAIKEYDNKHLWSLKAGSTTEDFMKAIKDADTLNSRLGLNAKRYAERNSNTTIKAVKTLLDKNHEIPLGDLVRSGIVDANDVLNNWHLYR